MAFVMGRLKELRELNHPILLIHHTPKASERLYKGSTAISDLADHVLKLYQSRRGGLEEIQEYEEPGIDARFVLTTGKTRFEHFHLFLSFDIETGEFVLAEDPNAAAVEAVTEYIKSETDAGRSLKQTDIVSWAKKEGIGPPRRAAFLALLNRGERELKWVSSKGFKGGRYYYPPTSS